MKAPLLVPKLLVLCLVLSMSTPVLADEPEGSGNCPPGQVEKAFNDGGAVTYQCLEAGASMVDDTNIQYGGEGDENTTGGSQPEPGNE